MMLVVVSDTPPKYVILHLAVETAATPTKPAYAGYKILTFGSGLFSVSPRRLIWNAIAPEFYSEGLVQYMSLSGFL